MNGDQFIEFVIWVLSLILAIIFFYNGIGKILEFPPQVARFEALAVPLNLLMAVGIVECLGGLMLTIPRLAVVGGMLLGMIMLTSAGLYLSQGDTTSSLRAIVIVFMLAGISYLRFRRRHINHQGHSE